MRRDDYGPCAQRRDEEIDTWYAVPEGCHCRRCEGYGKQNHDWSDERVDCYRCGGNGIEPDDEEDSDGQLLQRPDPLQNAHR